ILYALLGLAPVLLGCSKADDAAPGLASSKGCSEVLVVPVSAHGVSKADAATANSLFARNNLDNRTFRYTRYSRESVQTYFPPYAAFDSQVVGVEEYASGLPVFTATSNFLFKDGAFHYRAGKPFAGTSLSAVPALKPGQLRALFEATINKVDPQRGNLQNKCVNVEFGYYDLNAGTSNAAENLVKAWRVTLKNEPYPFAYYEDKDGRLIYYDNGFRTFR
ncbi:MAG TPA: hypothetical protein VF629_07930, partial [Hymenobacter sp.]|uniref:hypothetical protein n=1 Tax=Hymenobacter sp. TaxID=1898978 RepID=UPI002EDB5840